MIANNRLANPDQDIESFSMKNFLLLCLGYWKWFLLSIVVFGGISLFYLARKQPVYERSEEILVKDKEKSSGVGEVTNSFSDLGLFANQTKVYNELISFTSPAVMMEVVDRLHLAMNYTHRDGLKSYTLYGTNQPVVVEFPELGEQDNVGLRLELQPDGRFELSKMWSIEPSGRVKYKEEVTGRVDGPAVKTPLGSVRVITNPGYLAPEGNGIVKEEMDIDIYRQGRLQAVEKYAAMLKGDLTDQDADVINLSIRDTSVERADDILNMVVTVYNERWMEDKNKVSIATSKFISERLKVIEQELGEVDTDIARQKSEMKLPDLEEATKTIMAKDLQISEQELQMSSMLAMSTYLKEYIEDPANEYAIIPMNTGTENEILEKQISDYNNLLQTRNKLADNSSDHNPLINDINRQLKGLKNSILRSTESNINNLQNALRNVRRKLGENQNVMGSSPLQAKNLLSVERQQLVMEELYLFLLQKREENELTQTFTADNTRIITPPYGKLKPVAPKKSLIFIISLLFGLGMPAVVLFLLESSNTKIRSKKDMENLPVPFAGEIPLVGKDRKWLKALQTKKKKQKEIDKPKIIVAEGLRDIPNEAFRVVRSNLDFMLGRGNHAIFALTSFNPGSGKSFVAYNLGASFALKGKSVLVIDGDLRHGSISGYVNSPRRGLSSYLTGSETDWHKLVVHVPDFKDFDVIPIGHKPPNPAELLENGRLQQLLEEAKQQYDVVLIDCPPVNIVVDTQIINQYVDRTIFVVRAGLLERAALSDIVNLVEENKLKNVSVLLNGTKTEFSSYHTYGNYEAIDKG